MGLTGMQKKALERQLISYIRRKNQWELEQVPIFELKDDGVHVQILNEGHNYVGQETFVISYEQFNKYLYKGLEKENNTDLWSKLGGEGHYNLRFPPRTVEFELKNDVLTMTEKIGGKGFYVIESIMRGREKRKCLADKNSIYEITYKMTEENNRVNIDVDKVKKFTGSFYQFKKETDLVEIPYLKSYLTTAVNQSKISAGVFYKRGIEYYITDLIDYDHSNEFLTEIERVKSTDQSIDWERVT